MNAFLLAAALLAGMSFLIDNPAAADEPPYTSFQTPTGYRPDNDIRTDAVIVYTDARDNISTWGDKGYRVQTMYGFRTGDDYIKAHPEEGQTMADGTILTCGPGSYYMVPTASRTKAAVDYFTRAIDNGTSAVIPEEPEFFVQSGYSESFKQAWQARYGEPWQDQTTSILARWKSDRLKAQMEHDMVRSIFDAAEKQKPSVTRMVACHSAVSYYAWGIIYPHYACLTLPNLQEIIGQVWTGTARTPCRYEGVVAERTFEHGLLEYSSLYNLARGSGRRMWFLMDPLEDNPDRSMEDYHSNYVKTLVASLMFPEVDAFEVMPWPTRIYGRVPPEFATTISSVIAALQDMHNQKTVQFDTGTRGIATFVADSMAWQRGEPARSNYDVFYGLTLPLVYRGIPIQVAQLERTPVPKYLDQYRVLLLSYDILKPMQPAYNEALADWVRAGGVLVYFGGSDPCNGLPEWWRERGFESPQAELYSRLGTKEQIRHISMGTGGWTTLGREKQQLRLLENSRIYKYDLKPYAKEGSVYVRFRDALPDDGWGPALRSVRLMDGDRVLAEFTAGTDAEKSYINEDSGSKFNGERRFADMDGFWVYRFDLPAGSAPVLEVDIGNQFVVEASAQPEAGSWRLTPSTRNALTEAVGLIDVPLGLPLTTVAVTRGGLYHARDHVGSVVFEQRVGKGSVIHVGIPGSYFAQSKQSAEALRQIAAYACSRAGVDYQEQPRLGIRRGSYAAMRTFEGSKQLAGRYVDILDPKLPVLLDPVVAPQRCAFYYDGSRFWQADAPALVYASGRVESLQQTGVTTSLRISGPQGTRGAARIYKGKHELESVSPSTAAVEDSGDTVLVTFDHVPESVEIKMDWR